MPDDTKELVDALRRVASLSDVLNNLVQSIKNLDQTIANAAAQRPKS